MGFAVGWKAGPLFLGPIEQLVMMWAGLDLADVPLLSVSVPVLVLNRGVVKNVLASFTSHGGGGVGIAHFLSQE